MPFCLRNSLRNITNFYHILNREPVAFIEGNFRAWETMFELSNWKEFLEILKYRICFKFRLYAIVKCYQFLSYGHVLIKHVWNRPATRFEFGQRVGRFQTLKTWNVNWQKNGEKKTFLISRLCSKYNFAEAICWESTTSGIDEGNKSALLALLEKCLFLASRNIFICGPDLAICLWLCLDKHSLSLSFIVIHISICIAL